MLEGVARAGGRVRQCSCSWARHGSNGEWYYDSMELVARPAREGFLASLVRSLAEEVLPPGRRSDAYAPAVVVVSSSGEEWGAAAARQLPPGPGGMRAV